MYHERLMYKFFGKHAGVSVLPRQEPHKEVGSNHHSFWSSEIKIGDRFHFLGFWYEVEENSLISHVEYEEYIFTARRIN
jgi:hypothetical protein